MNLLSAAWVMMRSWFVGNYRVELCEMGSSPFSGGWGFESMFFKYRQGDMVNGRAVRYCT